MSTLWNFSVGLHVFTHRRLGDRRMIHIDSLHRHHGRWPTCDSQRFSPSSETCGFATLVFTFYRMSFSILRYGYMRGSRGGVRVVHVDPPPPPPPCKIPISLNYIITKICLKPPLANSNNLWIEAPGRKKSWIRAWDTSICTRMHIMQTPLAST